MRVSQLCPQRFPREFSTVVVSDILSGRRLLRQPPSQQLKEYHDDTGEGRSVGRKYPKNTDNLQHQRDRFESTMDLPKTALNATTSSNKISRIPIHRLEMRERSEVFLCLESHWFSCQRLTGASVSCEPVLRSSCIDWFA